jgi:hypothetical protein
LRLQALSILSLERELLVGLVERQVAVVIQLLRRPSGNSKGIVLGFVTGLKRSNKIYLEPL